MRAFSRSSCSRAATPAEDRASTRCTSMYAMRTVEAEAAGAGCCATPESATASTTPITRMRTPRQCFIPTLLKRRAYREVERPRPLARPRGNVEAIVHPDGAERRLPSYTPTRPITQIRRIELGVEAVDVPDVEEQGDPQAEGQRHDVFDVPEDITRSTLLEPARVDGRDTAEFKGADRVRAAQIEALVQRHLDPAPAGQVAGLAPQRQDVAEPDGLEVGLQEGELVELGIAPETGEIGGHRGLRPLARRRDHVPAVARQRGADRRGDRGALLGLEVGRGEIAQVLDDVLGEPVAGVPAPVLGERVAHPEIQAGRVVRVVLVVANALVDVEAARERPVE